MGFSRATGDLDIWVAIDAPNAVSPGGRRRVPAAAKDRADGRSTSASGDPDVDFRRGVRGLLRAPRGDRTGIAVNFIRLEDLKRNKKASGRLKDQLDLEQLP